MIDLLNQIPKMIKHFEYRLIIIFNIFIRTSSRNFIVTNVSSNSSSFHLHRAVQSPRLSFFTVFLRKSFEFFTGNSIGAYLIFSLSFSIRERGETDERMKEMREISGTRTIENLIARYHGYRSYIYKL